MKPIISQSREWIPWMRRALNLAALAEGETSPNPLVGAVVLDKSGTLVGEGFHSRAGKPHAEKEALDQAGIRAREGTLLVTLEPCCHYGRTPPCTEAVLKSGLKRVVVALEDPDPRVSGQGISLLKKSGLEVITGVLEEEAFFQNRAFFFRVRNGRPWGTLKWAMSLDGRNALTNGESKWISNPQSRKWVHALRAKSDAVIVGGGTVRADNPLLTSRGLSEPEPLRVVLTKTLELPLEAQLWDVSIAKTLISYPSKVDKQTLLKLPVGPDRLPLNSCNPIDLVEALAKRNCNSVLWECGPALASLAIKQGCVQELVVVVAPKLLGGISANTPLSDLGFTKMDEAFVMEELSLRNLGDNWLMNMKLSGHAYSFL